MNIVRFGKEGVVEPHTASGDSSERVTVRLGPEQEKSDWFLHAYDNFEDEVENVLKYTGEPAVSFKEWMEENTTRFSMS